MRVPAALRSDASLFCLEPVEIRSAGVARDGIGVRLRLRTRCRAGPLPGSPEGAVGTRVRAIELLGIDASVVRSVIVRGSDRRAIYRVESRSLESGSIATAGEMIAAMAWCMGRPGMWIPLDGTAPTIPPQALAVDVELAVGSLAATPGFLAVAATR